MKDAVIDYETLGISHDTVILSLGCVVFDFNKQYTYEQLIDPNFEGRFYIKFDVEDQVKNYGRTINKNTLDWWKGQGEDAQKVLKRTPEDMKFVDAVNAFDKFLLDAGMMDKSQIWCRGQDFDISILKSMYTQMDMEEPVKFWNYRDIRTAIQCWCGERRGRNFDAEQTYKELFIKHDAYHDCAAAVIDMQHAIRRFLG